MAKVFEGRTVDAEAPFLSAEFWEKGTQIKGVIERSYDTENGPCYVLELEAPVQIRGMEEECQTVCIGNLSGLVMALQAARASLRNGDFIELECEGHKPPSKEGYSPRPNFRLKIVRP